MPINRVRRNLLLRALPALAASAPLLRIFPAFAETAAMPLDGGMALSAPVTHGNLAIYFVRGPSASGPVPLTLAEAMKRGTLHVYETGDVNSLQVENLGAEPVFVQSGDIVKGGKQDRVLTVSLIVPPKSGRLPIAAFCVEQGRWSPRGQESAGQFHASSQSMPSRKAKLAMKAPLPAGADRPGRPAGGSDTSLRQRAVWGEVAAKQAGLARAVGAPVASQESHTSLQLTLENRKLAAARAGYAAALRETGETDADILGYVFAINGKINSADVYGSNALFRKMWPKLLEASITEALGEKAGLGENTGSCQTSGADNGPAPALDAVAAFLRKAEQGTGKSQDIAGAVKLETRGAGEALLFDTRLKSGAVLHRNYLAAK